MLKLVRTRSRAPRRVKLTKRRRRTTKLHIDPELQAPITAEIEDDLKNPADREYAEIARGFRAAAAPAFRACRWTVQDEKNRTTWLGEIAWTYRHRAGKADLAIATYRDLISTDVKNTAKLRSLPLVLEQFLRGSETRAA